MKRKLKCYFSYTTFLYRALGMILIPCVFWVACVAMLEHKYGGIMVWEEPPGMGMYIFYFALSVYVVLYEILTDHWVLGGCLSDAGRGLRYFRTSHNGAEVMRNIVMVDLARRFLYCMVFAAICFLFTGWETAFVMGLAMYCVIVGVLNGSRHVDSFQMNTWIALLAQVGMAFVNVLNVSLIKIVGRMTESGETVVIACLAVLYCGVALGVSKVTVRRITGRIQSTGEMVFME